jgi:hypothetical protein
MFGPDSRPLNPAPSDPPPAPEGSPRTALSAERRSSRSKKLAPEGIVEGLSAEWSERQARRFGKDVSAGEVATATPDGV